MGDVKKKVKGLPDAPGIYMMADKRGRVLYVGKALSLKKRVGSYFCGKTHQPRIKRLISEIDDIEYFTTKSEIDALILECSLIKRYHPPYNVDYRDDKSYPFVKITKEDFSSVSLIRIPPSQVQLPSSKNCILFGPFPKVKIMKEALKAIRGIFPVRSCSQKMGKGKTAGLCLDYHLGICSGPCQQKIDTKDYRELIRGIYLLFRGERKGLARILKRRMLRASGELRFEDAARIRNQLSGLEEIMSMGRPGSCLSGISQPGSTIKRSDALNELRQALNLSSVPISIEGLDISNMGGSQATGSVVVFRDGMPFKSGYRHFAIKTVEGSDDIRMLIEVASRHYREMLDPRSDRKTSAPDLIVVDGGIGQLNAVSSVFEKHKIEIPIIGLAKKFEEIFKKEGKDVRCIKLPLTSAALQLIQHIRDEAHRFAIQYHKLLRGRGIRASVLDDVPGIGEKRRNMLLEHFGSVQAVREASTEELRRLGIPSAAARQILSIK